MIKHTMGFAFHVHHDKLFEYCTNYQERVDYIKRAKPANEVELRLKLLKIIPSEFLPHRLDEAVKARNEAEKAHSEVWEAYNKAAKAQDEARKVRNEALKVRIEAENAYDKAVKARSEAWEAYNEALEAHAVELTNLHSKLCPNCPWNGRTIFSKPAKSPPSKPTN